MSKIKIVVVEDQTLFRDGILALLRQQEDLEIVATYENGKLFLNYLDAGGTAPDVALVDMNMPELNGPELVKLLKVRFAGIRAIILTVYNQERFITNMIEAGVAGYLVKNCDIEEVLLAIRTVHAEGFYYNADTMKAMRNGFTQRSRGLRSVNNIPIDLTEREIEVLRLICKELTNVEIAEQMHISNRTVEGHRNNLLAKTGCKNTAGLVLYAISHNILGSETLR